MDERHRILNEPDLDATSRLHFGDIDRESGSMLFLPGIDALEQVAQPCATFSAVVELREDVAPESHKNRLR
jgi:hypothetical protein